MKRQHAGAADISKVIRSPCSAEPSRSPAISSTPCLHINRALALDGGMRLLADMFASAQSRRCGRGGPKSATDPKWSSFATPVAPKQLAPGGEARLLSSAVVSNDVSTAEPMHRRFVRLCGYAVALLLFAPAFWPTSSAAQIAVPPKGSSVHFALTGPDGTAVTEQSYRGKWLAIYFGYTFCPDICPTTMMELAQAFEALGPRAAAVQAVFISVDPQRDKPDLLAEYLKSFDPRFVGLSGSSAQISAAAKSFNVFYERHDTDDGNYTYDHSSYLYLVDPGGQLVEALRSDRGSEQIVAALLSLMGRNP
jgi:protein SCO1